MTDEAKPITKRIAVTIAILFIAWKVVFLTWYALHSLYAMDEYIQASYSILIPDGFYTHVDPLKTVLYIYYFDVARFLATDSNSLMVWARMEALLLAFAMAAICSAAAWRLWRTCLGVLFSLVILLSFSNFLEHSFRVRSDTLAAFFSIAALVPLLAPVLAGRRCFTAGLLIGLAFLSTQKAAYAALAIGVAILVHSGSIADRIRRSVIYTAGFAVVLLAYAFYFGGTDPVHVLRSIVVAPIPLVTTGARYFEDLRRYEVRTLILNPVAYAVCVAAIAAALLRWERTPPVQRATVAATIVLTAAVFLHDQPWPYVFVHCLPFLAVCAPNILERLPRPHVVALLLVVALTPTLARNVAYTRFDNELQQLTVTEAERQLAPADRYQDGIGMLPTRRPAAFVWWDAMNVKLLHEAAARGDRRELAAIVAGQPKLWILNYRVLALADVLQPAIVGSYVRVFPNVLLAGTALPHTGAVRYVNRWPGTYRVFGIDGRPRDVAIAVDGRGPVPSAFIPAGAHLVAIGPHAQEALFLLPADANLADFGRLPPPAEIFAGVYE